MERGQAAGTRAAVAELADPGLLSSASHCQLVPGVRPAVWGLLILLGVGRVSAAVCRVSLLGD